jgi:NhaP-type Na+/H+ or K+/H+ antiporter
MGAGSATLVLATIFLWGVFSARAARADLSTPFIFVAAGVVYTEVFDVVHFDLEPELVKLVAEVTLVWVLFADVTRVQVGQLRHDAGLYFRLLGIGLPLTVGLGAVVAVPLLGLSLWPALLVAAALAPTDAALGAAVMSDRSVPRRIRRAINVESGLNDGIVTPVVLLAIAGVAESEGIPRRRRTRARCPEPVDRIG